MPLGALHREKFYTQIKLRGNTYPVYRLGNGPHIAICIGVGTTLLRTFSTSFYAHFTVYSCDNYWINTHPIQNTTSITMLDIINDFTHIMSQLDLVKPIVFAHSCFGIVALEAAKREDHNMSSIVLVASPPTWNNELIANAESYFEQHASPARKQNHQQRQKHYQEIKQPGDSIINLTAYEADSAKYWGDFNISHEILAAIWSGIEAEDNIMNQFFNHILPSHSLEKNIEKVSIPVLQAAGEHDYDSIPLIAWETFPKPANYSTLHCGKVGHWPHYENPEVFDSGISLWLKRVVNSAAS